MKLKLLCLITAATLLFSCSNSEKKGAEAFEKTKTIMVQSHRIQKGELEKMREFSGIVASKKTAMIVPKISGYIQDIPLKEGDRFKKGELLLAIKSDELVEKEKFAVASAKEAENGLKQATLGVQMAKTGLRQAEANYELALKTYNRFQALLKNESVSKQEFDEVEAKYKLAMEEKKLAEENVKLSEEKVEQMKTKKSQADAMVSEARTFLSYTKVRAPFDGVVLEKLADVGNLGSYSTPVLKVGTLENEIVANLTEDLFKSVKVGEKMEVLVGSLDKKFTAEVVEIARNIEPATRTFRVKIKGNNDLVPGMYAKISIKMGSSGAICIPESFIFERGQLKMVFLNNQNRAEMRIIRTGTTKNGCTEIVSGLIGKEELVKPVDNSEINSGDILEVK